MDNAWQRYLEAASGLSSLTQQRAEQLVKSLVKQGELAAERAEKAADELLKRSEQNRKVLANVARSETEKAVGRLGLARQRDIDRLERRIAQLEQSASSRSAGKKTTKKSAKRSKAAASKRSTKKAAAPRTAKRAKKTSSGSSS